MSFIAEFVGQCHCGCEELFDRGTELIYSFGGDIIIAGHSINDEPLREICSKCNMELPATGVCGNCT